MALEFALLLLTLCYVSTFSLHDVRRLLTRPQRGRTAEATLEATPAWAPQETAAARDATNLLMSSRATRRRASGSPPRCAPRAGATRRPHSRQHR